MKESSSQACNCNSELESLRGKTDQMGVAFVCSVSRSLLQVELGLTCMLSAGPTSMVSTLESTASQFAWVVLEDQALQAKMVAARIKRNGGVEVVIVQSALQVSTFTQTLVNSALYSIALSCSSSEANYLFHGRECHDARQPWATSCNNWNSASATAASASTSL